MPCRHLQLRYNASSALIQPLKKSLYFGCGVFGSLTMYCKSVDDKGITSPPADFIAAVDPVAVQILSPLDRE